jgi:hypothetical protein
VNARPIILTDSEAAAARDDNLRELRRPVDPQPVLDEFAVWRWPAKADWRVAWRGEESQLMQYYHNGTNTIAIPCEAVEALAVPAAGVVSRFLDRPSDTHPGTDRVVLYEHLTALRRQYMPKAPKKRKAAA